MLGYLVAAQHTEADRVLAEVAARLVAMGWPLVGVLQIAVAHADPGRPCHIDLAVLQGQGRIRISQDRGALARGCRLDPQALEAAVGLVEAGLETGLASGPRLLVVNRFGRQEVEGRGFRAVIGRALAMGVPVITAVNAAHLADFRAFGGGLEQALVPDVGAVTDWCLSQG